MALAKFCEVKVVAPVPWVPISKLLGKKYQLYPQVPHKEIQDEIEVFHPRYFVTPKIGRALYGFMYYFSILKFMRRLYKKYAFDLLDVHWAYPDGFAGVLFGKLFNKPTITTIRGTDINIFPRYYFMKKMIVYSLKRANRVISVCSALKEKASELGIEKEKITVMPNGVDILKFYKMKKIHARGKLNLSHDKKIILSVGHLVELKGFHYIIDAVNKLVKGGGQNNILLIVIGEGEYRNILERQIWKLKLDSLVNLVGYKSYGELVYWYNAADVFCLASSREGWPNVIFESLACGTPVVATSVSGIPEILCSDEYGILVKKRTADEIAAGIYEGLKRKWDKERLVEYAGKNTWDRVGEKVYQVFQSMLSI